MIMKVYDVSDKIIGRVMTRVVKDLLKGKTVHIVNCEKAVMSGNPNFTKEHYLQKIQRGDKHHGPFHPKTPQGIVKRVIRGMLPYKINKGKNALSKLKIWISIPPELEKAEKIIHENADVKKLKTKYITIGELSIALGTKNR